MSRVLIGFKDMKEKDGKVLYFGEKTPWTTGVEISDEKYVRVGVVYGEEAKRIDESCIGKEVKKGFTFS